jgi:hypothetical protein
MLWHSALSYKAWLDTRWRFLIGLAVLTLSAGAIVFTYDDVLKLLPLAAQVDPTTAVGRQISEQAQLVTDYRSYIWSQWIRDDMRQLAALFAVVIAAGGLLSQASRGGGLFTLSLPVSRAQLLGARAWIGLAELAALTVLPLLLIAALSPVANQRYGIGDALMHGLAMFAGASVLFAGTMLLSTVFNDIWRPPLIVLCVTVVMHAARLILQLPDAPSLLGVMTGEHFFWTRELPVVGLLITAALSAAMLYAASLNVARRDF